MNRRSFLSRLGIGAAAIAVPTVAASKESKLEDGSLRPMCPHCKTKMLMRHGEGRPYAFCPLTTCKRYGVEISLQPRG